MHGAQRINSLPNNKILDRSNLTALADDKVILIQMVEFVFQCNENAMEKVLVTTIVTFPIFVSNCRLQTLSIWKHVKFIIWERVYSLPNNRMSDLFKLTAVADDKVIWIHVKEFVFHCKENAMEKGKALVATIFSSTDRRPASLLSWSVVRLASVRPCVNFFFKHLLL